MRRVIAGITAVIVLAFGITACGGGGTPSSEKQRTNSVKARAKAFAKAEAAAPLPQPKNFPLRKALVEFTKRQDEIDHPWYVYILADTGNAIGYYVAKTVPVNACNFLSSTEDVRDDEWGNLKMTAPSLDGIYYGGSGASGACDSWFFFDSATNALVQIRGVKWFSSDQPLRLDAKPIVVAGK